ncbi:Dihydropyrimidinase-like protein [Drosera capensis]
MLSIKRLLMCMLRMGLLLLSSLILRLVMMSLLLMPLESLMPGGIDPHTHLALEVMDTETIDDFFHGQAAALAGGTTMHIDFVVPVSGNLTAGFEAYEKKTENACMDYGFHMIITKWDDEVLRELEIMVKEKGINSFKFFMAYKGAVMINDELLLDGFKRCKSLGALAMVHAENGDAVVEGQKRMTELGITGPEGHDLSRPALDRGYVMSPPIRETGHDKALQAALPNGLLQLVGTDHCAFNSTQKAFGIDDFCKIPNESGQISPSDYVRMTSTDAKIFSIYPRKGAILAGSDADIIILNPNASFKISANSHHSRSNNNVYEGFTGKGKVEVTIAGGRIVWRNEELKVVAGSGKHVKMSPYSYLFSGIARQMRTTSPLSKHQYSGNSNPRSKETACTASARIN